MKSKGFTLIELLVVISIIGMLSSVVLASLGSARAKARDARRMTDLKQLQVALELYYDTNKQYPNSGGSANWRGHACYGGYDESGSDGWIPYLAPTYMSVLPYDPRENSTYCYLYTSNGVEYKILAYGTAEHTVLSTESFYDPARPGSTMQISTPGALNW